MKRVYYRCLTCSADSPIDTTDVQRVVAVQTDSDSITVQCDFISGSDAGGCMVVLVCDDGHNTTAMLSRGDKCTTGTLNTTKPLNCCCELFGFDIESNGSVGTLAVPGELIENGTDVICSEDQPSSELIPIQFCY